MVGIPSICDKSYVHSTRTKHLKGREVSPSIYQLALYKQRHSQFHKEEKRRVTPPAPNLSSWSICFSGILKNLCPAAFSFFIGSKKASFVVVALFFAETGKIHKICQERKNRPMDVDELYNWV